MPKLKNPRHCDGVDRHVAKQIRVVRRSHDMSQTTLGARLGVTFQQVQKYENGTNRISVGRLVAIAKVLKEPIGIFLPSGVTL